MSALSPAWYVKRVATGNSYIVGPSGSDIIYRPNSFAEANMVFEDSAGSFTNIFSTEDEVQIFIGDPAGAGVKMLHGFVDEIHTKRYPTRRRTIDLHIVDWGSYLAAKRIFEKKYFKATAVNTIFTQTLGSVTDGVDTLTGTNVGTISTTLKQFFEGTYVKDVWHRIAELGDADYFVDENLDLNAFTRNSKLLQLSGNTYKIQDIPPSLNHHIMIRHDKLYDFIVDASQRFRSVTVTNGSIESHPKNVDEFQTAVYHDDALGKDFSRYYIMGTFSDYDVDTIGTSINPASFTSDEVLDSSTPTITRPTIKLNVASTSQNIGIDIRPHTATTVGSFGLDIDSWQEISFWLKNSLTRASGSITSLKLQLFQDGINYWERDIVSYLSSSWKYFRFQLPSTTSNAEPYTGVNWTKVGSPTTLNRIFFDFTPATGYNTNSGVSFSQMVFYRTLRATQTGAGNPPTQKIIVDKSLTGFNSLSAYALTEQGRISQEIKRAQCTIPGNTAFKKPAYRVDVDFTTTLGTGRSGTLRMDEIRHYLDNGIHLTDITFNNSFYRP